MRIADYFLGLLNQSVIIPNTLKFVPPLEQPIYGVIRLLICTTVIRYSRCILLGLVQVFRSCTRTTHILVLWVCWETVVIGCNES